MDALDIFAFVVMGVTVLAGVAALIVLAKLPGDVARKKNHPQASAINVCGWLGLVSGGILWAVALIWAYLQPGAETASGEELRHRIASLEQQIQTLQQQAQKESTE